MDAYNHNPQASPAMWAAKGPEPDMHRDLYELTSRFSDLCARAERIAGTHTLGSEWVYSFDKAHKEFCDLIARRAAG